MTYSEIKKTYRWALKTYPGIDNGSLIHADTFDSAIVGTLETKEYYRLTRRAVWKLIHTETQDITAQNYLNGVDAIPFFRGLGGYERAELNYTSKGYLPTVVTSINPDKTRRFVRTYRFN